MIRIEGIGIGDVARLMANVIYHGSHPLSLNTDEFMSTEVSRIGVCIKYEHVDGPVWVRHYLRGKRWSLWFDLSRRAAFTSNSDATKWDPEADENYVSLGNQVYRMQSYDFRGDWLDFHNDLTIMRTAGMI